MAFLDFLNKPVTAGYAEGPNQQGDAGVQRPGITYGDIARIALQYGSKPGSSGPMFGGMIPKSGAAQKTGAMLDLTGGKKEEDSGFGNMLLKGLASYFLG